jgi:hypothetical protein
LTNLKRETPFPGPLTREAALKTTALAATLLFAHGQTTERTVTAAERFARALGVTVRVLPYWGELTVELDGAPISQIVPAKPLGVDMGRVLAVTTVIDQVCDGTLPAEAAQSALESAGRRCQLPRHASFCSQPWRGFAWRDFRRAGCNKPAADRDECRHRCARQTLAVRLQP